MKSIRISLALAMLACLQTINCWSNTTSSSKTSSSASSTITPKPTYCGNCTIYYEVHAHLWWSSIFTTWAATWIYTVDKGSGSTIGSSLKYPLNTTAVVYPNFTQYIMNRDGGAIEYTTLNTLNPTELTTITAENTISMTGPNNVYIVSTKFLNTTLSPPQTQCVGGAIYYAPLPSGTAYNASLTIKTVPGVPASTTYTYTTSAVNFGANWTLATALGYGLDSLATAVGSVLQISSACIIGGGGGVGTLKVGVTALTTSSLVFVNAQAVTTTSTIPTSTVSTAEVKTILTSTSTSSDEVRIIPPSSSVAPEQVTTTTPILSVGIVTTLVITTSGPAGLQTLIVVTTPLPGPTSLATDSGFYTTIYVETISGSLGTETLSVTATLPIGSVLGSYTTTLVKTIQGPSGSQTLSQVVTLPIASYILSLIGITGAPTTVLAVLTTTPTSRAGSTGTSSSQPSGFTGSGAISRPSVLTMSLTAFVLIGRFLI